MKIKSIWVCLLMTIYLSVFSQNTIGTLSYDFSQTQPGYNLVYPHSQSTTYLLNNCGQLIHKWEDEEIIRPGNSAYLTNNGDLIRAKKDDQVPTDPIFAGGAGGIVESVSWENELNWSFELNTNEARLHHDIAVMPNGNVLMIAWELISEEEAIQAGRDTAKMAQNTLWPDQILEYDPNLDAIVWEWHAWDHLIQDFDASKNNFGEVGAHPELIDLNWDTHDGHPDWMHANAIDYNPVLDQILISVPYFNECWIIDHSTTTEEAAGHTGGQWGRGGDLLFRWGNPATYQNGDASHQQLFFQHDTEWVKPSAMPDDPDFGKISLFNNRVTEDQSTANFITTTPDLQNFDYPQNNSLQYLPESFSRTISHPDNSPLAYSSGLSSVQQLENGNVLVLAGRFGYAYEITTNDQIVWEYRVPLQTGDRIDQGTELMTNENLTFRMDRYNFSHPAFEGRVLAPQNFLELNPDPMICELATSIADLSIEQISIFPNPVEDILNLTGLDETSVDLLIYNAVGLLITQLKWTGQPLNISFLPSGVYFVNINGKEQAFIKFIKL